MNNLDCYKKSLRVDQTTAEEILWSHVRNRKIENFKFRRQHVLQNYIVDFVCLEKKLIIELDGEQHGRKELYDKQRTRRLQENGFQVLRFWNFEVLKDPARVIQIIHEALVSLSPCGRGRRRRRRVRGALSGVK